MSNTVQEMHDHGVSKRQTDMAVTAPRALRLRRNDLVQLPDGARSRVVAVSGGYVHTEHGTYAPWQLTELRA
jgi:hypothetical protein